jgi:hypothetical protein
MKFLPLFYFALVFWVGGNLMGAAAQVAKAHADRLAVTVCEVSQDCR